MMTFKHNKQLGINLSEVLISLAIIAVLASLLFGLIWSTHQNNDTKSLEATQQQIQDIFTHEAVTTGLIPKAITPVSIVSKVLQYTAVTPTTYNSIVGKEFILANNNKVFVPNDWSSQRNGDVALVRVTSNSGSTSFCNIYRNNPSKSQFTNSSEGYNFNTSGQASNTHNSSTSIAAIKVQNTVTDVTLMTRMDGGGTGWKGVWDYVYGEMANGNTRIEGATMDYLIRAIGLTTDAQAAFNAKDLTQQYMDNLNIFKEFYGNSLSNFNNAVSNGGAGWLTIAGRDGRAIETIGIRDFVSNATYDGMPLYQYLDTLFPNNTNRFQGFYNSGDFTQLAYGLMYSIMVYDARNTEILINRNNKTYKVNSQLVWFSPVKINLSGKDAALDNTDNFNFDADGFLSHKAPGIKTAGGLTPDEAWLAMDRGAIGFYRNGVMDGDDVFGDHLGVFRSGYDDLAHLFRHSLSIDGHGKRYIALHPLSGWDKLWINLTRLFGQNKAPIASMDLKLLTRERVVMDAADHLSRVYVDYQDVNELAKDKSTWIRQRSNVVFKNGKSASSADIWFRPQVVFTIQD